MKPLAIDLYCGLGGWTEGLLAEGYDVVGFDIERHAYGDHRYPAQVVLQDVRSLHGRQFRDAALIVGSSPCQEFSYRAMPWKRARSLPHPELGIALFQAQFRIQREAVPHTPHMTNPDEHAGIKQPGISGTRHNGRGDRWFQDGAARHGSKSAARKQAAAIIAKIPLPLAQHIAAVYHPARA